MEFRMDFVASVPGADEIRKLQLGMRWFQIGLQILPRSSFDLDNRMRSFAGGSGARKKGDNICTGTLFFFHEQSIGSPKHFDAKVSPTCNSRRIGPGAGG
jgi:hypothetical protein